LVAKYLYSIFLRAPGVRGQVKLEVAKSVEKLQEQLLPKNVTRYLRLPAEGWTKEQIDGELNKLSEMEHTRWEDGRVSGAVYSGRDDIISLQTDAFQKFAVSNPIHPDVFPGIRKMEAEVVAMVLSIFNAPDGAAGATTSGGTESILMACLSAREKAYNERGVIEPEM
jgi:sphinganine-1-phosphate aldolase